MNKVNAHDRFIGKTDWISAGIEKRAHTHAPRLHCHEGYELILITEGSCRIQIEEQRCELRHGDCVFLAEGEYHAIHVPGSCTLTYLVFRPGLWLNSRPLLERFFEPYYGGFSGGTHQHTCTAPLLRQICQTAKLVQSCADDLTLAMSTFKLMTLFPRIAHLQERQSAMASRLRVQRALDLIHEDFSDTVTLARMAAACKLSPATFKRVFRQGVGTSPKQMLIAHRLDQTANQLATTNRKVIDIAFSTGFGSLTNFNRRFLTRFGVTPNQYRTRTLL